MLIHISYREFIYEDKKEYFMPIFTKVESEKFYLVEESEHKNSILKLKYLQPN